MALFNSVNDRQQTQLAYRVRYFPFAKLSDVAKELIKWRHHTYIKKSVLLEQCNDTLEIMYYKGRPYKIVWAYGSVPTEKEWNKLSDDFLIKCEFRASPAIKETAVVVLSFFTANNGDDHGEQL